MPNILFVLILAGVASYIGMDKLSEGEPTEIQRGVVMGKMPHAIEHHLLETVQEALTPLQERPQKVVIKRIPKIRSNMRMPHPYWGQCTKCHLFHDKVVNNKKTPVGKALGKVAAITKVGPPILPDSSRPHPAAGRCIKCHDIVVKEKKI
ncbi:MAG: magnetochrome domain-containing protein [SAR324 cluster bacterium]|nr:magnetochrome domain-containing protein [SAR324 cluster bacterium]